MNEQTDMIILHSRETLLQWTKLDTASYQKVEILSEKLDTKLGP